MKSDGAVEDIYELSPVQQGMLFHTLTMPETGIYFQQLYGVIEGELSTRSFEGAWKQLIEHYAILRTAFYWEQTDRPLQVVYRQVTFSLALHDWRGQSPHLQKEQLQNLLAEDRQRGFDLSKAPLMRVCVIHLTDTMHQFVWSFHHLLLDGWSVALVLKDLLTCYAAHQGGRQDVANLRYTRPYRDYILWLQSQSATEAEAYWRRLLAQATAPTVLAIDHQSVMRQSGKPTYGEQTLSISADTREALLRCVQTSRVTLSTIIHGAWAIVMSRYSGKDEVIFGTVVSGRAPEIAGVDTMVGLLINTLPLRVQIPYEQSVNQWLQSLQAQLVEMRRFEYSSLVQVQNWSDIPHSQPLFESIVVFENYPIQVDTTTQVEEKLRLCQMHMFEYTNYPLTIAVLPGTQLVLRISYDSCRFDMSAMQRLLGHLQMVLEGIAADPAQRVGTVPLLTPAELKQVVTTWNTSCEASDRPDICVHQVFEAQVERTPDVIAVVCEEMHLTYTALNQWANQLARDLQTQGVQPGELIGLSVERSVELAGGLLGILKAGGVYVPLDPDYPKERLAHMLRDAQVRILLTQTRFASVWADTSLHTIFLDIPTRQSILSQKENLPSIVGDSLVYVIYTSGSTGKPKGAGVYQHGFSNLLLWMASEFTFGPTDRTLVFTSLSFDLTQKNILLPLITGGTLHLASPGIFDPESLMQQLVIEQITYFNCTPSAFYPLIEEVEDSMQLGMLRCVFLGGETVLSARLAKWRRLHQPGTILVNYYGPTECTDLTTTYCVREEMSHEEEEASLPIGRPMRQVEVWLLDRQGEMVPIGVAGEIYIGGVSVGMGYIHQAALTAERFVPHPWSQEPGQRLYRTGDLGRYREDGMIEFLGRMDQQVKLRGYRVELEEIETVLLQHTAIREVVVLMYVDETSNGHLVAYIVPDKTSIPSHRELHQYMTQWLPDYMVPSAFIHLEQLPLTSSGKIHRNALPAPATMKSFSHRSMVEPRTDIERILVAIWSETLGVDRVSIDDNFFDIGGHSLLLLQVGRRLRKIKRTVTVTDLFTYPTISSLAEYLTQEDTNIIHTQEIQERANKQKAAIHRLKPPMKKG